MNTTDAITALWLTKAHWPNFQVLDGERQALQAGAWIDILADVDLIDVRAALAELDASGNDFPPTPGQIRTTILRQRGALAPDFAEAWTEVVNSISRHGSSLPTAQDVPPWSHPAITETVKAMGGRAAIGHSDNPTTIRAQFQRHYEAAAQRSNRGTTMPPIVRQLNAGTTTPALPARR